MKSWRYCLVVYDIGDTQLRTQLLKQLRRLGLESVQRSCVLGCIPARRMRQVVAVLGQIEGRLAPTDRVLWLPLSRGLLDRARFGGEVPDLNRILKRRRVYIL